MTDTSSAAMQGSGIVFGVIHDVFGHTNTYQVHVTGGGIRQATYLGGNSTSPLGARTFRQLPIFTPVACYFPDDTGYGYIIGALPPQTFDARYVIPQSLVMRSCVGTFYDAMHYSQYQNEDNDLANFSCARPVDVEQGDWGAINELGMAVWIGKMLTQVRASDVAKLECYWGDDLVRLFAYNYQHYTAGKDSQAFDDEGEYNEVEFYTPFMWEALGSYEPGKEVFEDNDGDTGGVKRGVEKSRFEPKEELQVMVPRGLRMRGYIGDIVRDMVVLPPPDKTGIAKSDDTDKMRGVLDIHCAMDGAYSVRSAKGILLEKSLMLPVPRRKRDPDDPKGDTGIGDSANYKPAGYYGSGPTHEKKPYAWKEDVPPGRASMLDDANAYAQGKYGMQVIDSHEEDWAAPEQSDVKIDSSTNNELDGDIFDLQFKPSAELPQKGEVKVDERTGHDKVEYYRSKARVQITDDGSIVMEDAYGSQITLSGGNIYLSCPGDVIARPGRSFITWAPRDFIARAGWCAEVSAAKKDVRIKAENNLHLLAGDGTTGSVLIECRATGKPEKAQWADTYGDDIESKGIILKAEDSAIDAWSNRVFVGATKEAAGTVEISSGRGKTVIDGDTVGIEALSQFGALVGTARSQTGSPGQFVLTQASAKLLASLDMVGDLGIWQGSKGSGSIKCDSNVTTKGSIGAIGSIYCAGSMAANGMSSTNEHNSTDGGRAPIINSRGGATQAAAAAARQPLYQAFEQDTQDDASAGAANQDVWDEVGFAFRDSEQYKADEWKVYESRHQQLYRAFGYGEQWDEPVVKAPLEKKDTRPHPGNETWTNSEAYQYADPSSMPNVDVEKGTPKKREEQTEEAPELKKEAPESAYLITKQTS